MAQLAETIQQPELDDNSPSVYSEQESEELDEAFIAFIRGLTTVKYESHDSVAFISPTWCTNAKLKVEDFLPDFKRDRDTALRDFACITAGGIRRFFKNTNVITANCHDTQHNILEDESLELHELFWPQPGIKYAVASDLSVSGDSCGVAIVHYEPNAGSGVYVLDGSARILASPQKPVDYSIFENLLINLRNRGCKIAGVGFDQFNSHYLSQRIKSSGIKSEIVAYHDSLGCCLFTKNLILTGELIYGPSHTHFIGEAKELIIKGKRIDHLTSGGRYNSKDTWDAAINAIFIAKQSIRIGKKNEYY